MMKTGEDFARYQKDWETNARIDAKWSVLTLDGKLGEGWDEKKFFEIGEQEIHQVFNLMDGLKMGRPALGRCLDFGCGVGRITQALATRFTEAVGIDISPSMIEQANAYRSRIGLKNIHYVLSTSSNLETEFGTAAFDLVYTNITLQHLNNDLQRDYIRQFAKIVKPEGWVIFQVPSKGPSFSLSGRMSKTLKTLSSMKFRNLSSLVKNSIQKGVWPWQIRMELNILPEQDVETVAKDAGLRLIKKTYIDWPEFYRSQRFALKEALTDVDSPFPHSPLYFFKK